MTKQQAALTIVGNVDIGKNPHPQLGPILIAIIVQILAWAIPKCANWIINHKTTAGSNTKVGLIKMIMLRHWTRSAFRNTGNNLADYKTHGESVVQAILKSYKEASLNQVTNLVNDK